MGALVTTAGRVARFLFAAFLLAGVINPVQSAARDLLYLGELNFRSGWHFHGESDEWNATRMKTIREEVLFTDESDFFAKSIEPLPTATGHAVPVFQFEAIMGVRLDKLPGLKNVRALKRFEGFRMGVGASLYPFTGSQTYRYAGKFQYENTNPPQGDPTTITSEGTLTINENYLLLAPSLNFYYYHEPGVIWTRRINRLVPYAGLEFGTSILSAKRKYKLESDPATVTVGGTSSLYQIDAGIQENFFNEFDFRFGIVMGAQWHLAGPHYLDLRLGYTMQNTTVNLVRAGNWNATASDKNTGDFLFSYSRKVKAAERETVFTQSGFQIIVGYTVGLL